MANSERGNWFIEKYKDSNKVTFLGFLGVAAAGAFFVPSIVAPALVLATIDGAQLVALNAWLKRKKKK